MTIGRGNFVVDVGRKGLFDDEFISNGNENGDGIGGRSEDRSLFPSSSGNGGGKNVGCEDDEEDGGRKLADGRFLFV